MTRLALALTLLFSLACCPIPLYRQVSVRPALAVSVQDTSGAPSPGAMVTVRRITVGPPPMRETHRWTVTADASGAANLDAIEQSESYMPLMMHGVEWYAWEVCAEHGGGAASVRHSASTPVEPPVALSIAVDPAKPDCGWEALAAHL